MIQFSSSSEARPLSGEGFAFSPCPSPHLGLQMDCSKKKGCHLKFEVTGHGQVQDVNEIKFQNHDLWGIEDTQCGCALPSMIEVGWKQPNLRKKSTHRSTTNQDYRTCLSLLPHFLLLRIMMEEYDS